MDRHDWVLKRNCSMAPRELALAYGVLCLLSVSVAVAFAVRGLWFVPLFSLLEMSAVTLALLHYARHATDYEHIALLEGCLLIEQVRAGRCQQTRLDPYWTSIAGPRRPRDLISLESKGVTVAVGRFVGEATRRRVAAELGAHLRRGF